ncbi:hypothetical protein B0H13DRAFT_1903570 [Mycena leptocephala]|nr:hypothetical protein B0H13DRAFT_1903570 [Mycena leptocephala]
MLVERSFVGPCIDGGETGREGTREKREPVVKVVRWSPSSESGDDGCATRTKWPSSYRGGAEEALEDEKHIPELGVRSTKVRVIWNIIIEKLKTAGAETCPTHGGPGGSKLKNQLHLTAGGHETTSCGHASPHVSAHVSQSGFLRFRACQPWLMWTKYHTARAGTTHGVVVDGFPNIFAIHANVVWNSVERNVHWGGWTIYYIYRRS